MPHLKKRKLSKILCLLCTWTYTASVFLVFWLVTLLFLCVQALQKSSQVIAEIRETHMWWGEPLQETLSVMKPPTPPPLQSLAARQTVQTTCWCTCVNMYLTEYSFNLQKPEFIHYRQIVSVTIWQHYTSTCPGWYISKCNENSQ